MPTIIRNALAVASALLAGSALPASAQEPACTGTESPYRLTVIVENVRSSDGLVAVTLYEDNAKRFLAKRGSLYVGRVPARAPVTRLCIHVPKPGIYAVASYHDADGDRKFDRNGIGLPAEGYGFSNNPSTLFGLPSFSSVRIKVPAANAQTTIRMKYP